jgi:hypothetical protein
LVPQSETGKINCVRLPRCGRLPPDDADSQLTDEKIVHLVAFATTDGTLGDPRYCRAGSISAEFDMHTPLANTQAKLDEIERELRKHPDFQLYLLSKTGLERASRERLLRAIPTFDLWLKLRNSIALATAAL